MFSSNSRWLYLDTFYRSSFVPPPSSKDVASVSCIYDASVGVPKIPPCPFLVGKLGRQISESVFRVPRVRRGRGRSRGIQAFYMCTNTIMKFPRTPPFSFYGPTKEKFCILVGRTAYFYSPNLTQILIVVPVSCEYISTSAIFI